MFSAKVYRSPNSGEGGGGAEAGLPKIPVQERQLELRALSTSDIGARLRVTRKLAEGRLEIEHRGVLMAFTETSLTLGEHEDRTLPGGEFGRRGNSDTHVIDLPPNAVVNITSGVRS